MNSGSQFMGSTAHQRYNTRNSDVTEPRPFRWSPLFVLMLAGIPAILALRSLYIALDDLNYVIAFSNEKNWLESLLASENWWLTVIEEPLWNIYAITAGITFGAEEAFRLTIFLGAILCIYCSANLAGNWEKISFIFVFSPDMATQMYFNQVRQGFALSIFLLLVFFLKDRPAPFKFGVASLVALLFHSSFIVAFLSALSLILKPSLRVASALCGAIVLFVITRSTGISEFVDFGRRKGSYADAGALNLNFYVITIATYAAVFLLLFIQRKKSALSEWYYFSLVLFIASISLTFVFEEAGRLLYTCMAVTSIMLAQYGKTDNERMAFVVWVISLIMSNVLGYTHDTSFTDSMLGRYNLILSSW